MIAPEILFALVAAVGFGVGEMWSAIPARKLSSTQLVFFELAISFFVYQIIAVLWLGSYPYINTQIILSAGLAGLFLTIALFSFFRAIAVGKVGLVTPVINADALVVVVVGYLFFNEVFVFSSYVAIGGIIMGIFLLSANFNSLRNFSFRESGLGWALVSMVSFGVVTILYKVISESLSVFETLLVVNIFATIFLLVCTPSNWPSYYQLQKIEKSTYIHLFGITITIIISLASLTYALTIAKSVSVPAVIAGSSPLVSVVLARLIFKESLTSFQYLGAIIIVVGIMILSL